MLDRLVSGTFPRHTWLDCVSSLSWTLLAGSYIHSPLHDHVLFGVGRKIWRILKAHIILVIDLLFFVVQNCKCLFLYEVYFSRL